MASSLSSGRVCVNGVGQYQMIMPGKKTALKDHHIVELPAQTMAVVRTAGDPNKVMAESGAMPALYGAAYALTFALKRQGVEYKVGLLYGRWPDAHLKPTDEWMALRSANAG